ncbi:FMN-dependent oxidoreductase, nitrilotriacetate monooxygenase family [Arboricoccus pini]|uniref:FMN-dependent oxidoreductase, nitrilotriacetate monooxygenase family n=1 Tax=Arboricoccus pini TaxID=1963835 RepID=A0A212RKG5_9PROT|nr:LLM class flavin-dependent oxidoreductase [Arboricoccus pini]SNB72956.1 FMN-dependent oxidoreductase, nitrilotriacetate monooxygenase family [Arboricoccus pini]
MASPRQLKLGAFLMSPGHHVAAWRHQDAQADLGADFKAYVRIAQAAEDAKFDLVFLDDTLAIKDTSPQTGRFSARSAFFEPITLLSGIAAVTERIGLAGTVSTTFNEPYTLARKFASLDLISQGRAAWNLVTSNTEAEARNFGDDPHLLHADRYRRAEEFIDVVTGLWASFDDDAFAYDKASGTFYQPDKMHVLNHKGVHFSVQGPLNVRRSPQGHPVVVQAGSSAPGMELAARTAEIVFTAQQTLADAQAFYSDLKARMSRYGRDPSDLLVMPGIFPVIGRTRAEAEDKFARLQDLIDPKVGIRLLSDMIGGFDLSRYPADGPVPDLPETNGGKSRQQLLFELARKEGLSILQLARRIAGARGHWQVVGTAEDIVDQLEERFTKGGADGFNIMPPTLPGGLNDFIELALPELRRRGLFRIEYEGRTLRENLGLRRPATSRFDTGRPDAACNDSVLAAE